MREKARGPVVLMMLFSIVLSLPRLCEGFNAKAHKELSRLAVDSSRGNASQLDYFLKNTLRYDFCDEDYNCAGIGQPIFGKPVRELIMEGAVNEDSPGARVFSHYHDPTRTWGVAGFKGVNISSIVWSQLPVQGAGANRSWKNARDAYFNALTATSLAARQQWYAETFRTIGHLIHHVQDAAVPAHTRDDNHFAISESSTLPFGDRFHYWAEANLSVIEQSISEPSTIQRFTRSLLEQASGNPFAPVPVARIIDKTDADYGVLSPNLNIGIAEYSNANFFSEHTVLSSNYPYPRLSQLQIGGLENSPTGHQRRYLYFRPGFGEQNYRLGTYSTLLSYSTASLPLEYVDIGLDHNVFTDYGFKLFPRAIGYSAGLIDYFFRGQISSVPNGNHSGIGKWTPYNLRPNSLTVPNVVFAGESQIAETAPGGTLRMVLIYDPYYNTSYDTPPDYMISHAVAYTPSETAQSVTFTFESLPFPSYYDQGFIAHIGFWAMLVYKGPLGQESNAVAGAGTCVAGSETKNMKYYTFYLNNNFLEPGLNVSIFDQCWDY